MNFQRLEKSTALKKEMLFWAGRFGVRASLCSISNALGDLINVSVPLPTNDRAQMNLDKTLAFCGRP